MNPHQIVKFFQSPTLPRTLLFSNTVVSEMHALQYVILILAFKHIASFGKQSNDTLQQSKVTEYFLYGLKVEVKQ